VVSRAERYEELLGELREHGGGLSLETRWNLAREAFATTAAYDAAIATALEARELGSQGAAADGTADDSEGKEAALPGTLRVIAPRKSSLRYGENPHQAAALYTDGSRGGIANAVQLGGKELSFNNLVDLDACWALARELADAPAVAIIKHTNPCGVAQGASVVEAYQRALEADPISAFGGVIGVNGPVDEAAAGEMAKLFVEAIVAPDFTPGALEILRGKKNLRLLRIRDHAPTLALKQISGGYLLQDEDRAVTTPSSWTVATEREPTQEETAGLLFAWTVCKHVKSNAIVYARQEAGYGQSVGIGAGQMSRVDAARYGAMKAVLPTAGTVAASDAFFPFPDGLESVAEAGATAVIQPGGSVRDAEVTAAANRLGLAMVFTGVRHFRHG
jgi:phosphoribosylaminoimidazolecarboxamide formyltransferase/IMP cyclohydrolase